VPESVLRLDELRKSYAETVALDGASFDVGAGQMFGFVGPNGAGKTTLMRIVLGVLAADSGRVLWHGAPIDAVARRRIGYMPEERGLYPKMRVRDQLVYMARLHGAAEAEAVAAADRWMERLGIEGRADDAVEALSLPHSTFETVVLVLVYFVLGYVLYGGLFAAAASLVSRQEDIQSTTGPILIVLIASYLATNAALGNTSGGLATIATFLPPMAPLVVPGRAAQGALPAGELVASLALMLVAIVVVIVLAARIYDRTAPCCASARR
jgi:hypothetical protein